MKDADHYQIQIFNSKNLDSLVDEKSTQYNSYTPGFLLNQGEYYWKVQAVNVYGTAGPWSKVRKIIISVPPKAPILLSPENGKEINYYYTTSVDFRWLSVDYATQYRIQIADNPSFISPVMNKIITTTTIPVAKATLKPIPECEISHYNFYWRVRAVNTYGTAGPWSAPAGWFVVYYPYVC